MPDQLVPNGHGPGTFDQIQALTNEPQDRDVTLGKPLPSLTVDPGSVVRYVFTNESVDIKPHVDRSCQVPPMGHTDQVHEDSRPVCEHVSVS